MRHELVVFDKEGKQIHKRLYENCDPVLIEGDERNEACRLSCSGVDSKFLVDEELSGVVVESEHARLFYENRRCVARLVYYENYQAITTSKSIDPNTIYVDTSVTIGGKLRSRVEFIVEHPLDTVLSGNGIIDMYFVGPFHIIEAGLTIWENETVTIRCLSSKAKITHVRLRLLHSFF